MQFVFIVRFFRLMAKNMPLLVTCSRMQLQLAACSLQPVEECLGEGVWGTLSGVCCSGVTRRGPYSAEVDVHTFTHVVHKMFMNFSLWRVKHANKCSQAFKWFCFCFCFCFGSWNSFAPKEPEKPANASATAPAPLPNPSIGVCAVCRNNKQSEMA